jgi:hypothetical protein
MGCSIFKNNLSLVQPIGEQKNSNTANNEWGYDGDIGKKANFRFFKKF